MNIGFHGTNEANARKILKEGFDPDSHFAVKLEDALEFGGTWVFMVKFKSIDETNWQFTVGQHLHPNRITRLTQYNPIVRFGHQDTFTRKEKAIHMVCKCIAGKACESCIKKVLEENYPL